MDNLDSFLSDIWGDGGRVFLAYKKNPTMFEVPPGKHWPEDREKIVNFLLSVSARKRDGYFAPPIYKDDAIEKTSENVLHSNCLWVDFDGNAKEGLSLLTLHQLPHPSYRLQTSKDGHEHWYWLLDAPAVTSEFEPVNEKITYLLNADKSGWDAAQVLRPPFTSNFKPIYKKPLPVDIIEYTGEKFSIDQFGQLPSVNSSIRENVKELTNLPSIADVLATYTWDAQHLDIFKNPPNVKGSRDETIMRLAYFCAETGMTDEAMYVVIDDLTTRLGKFVGRRDRERRLAEIINNARRKHPYGVMREEPTEEDIQQVYTLNEMLKAEWELEWLVNDLIPKGTINIISAESGIGKSRISLQLQRAMAMQTKFLEWDMHREIKTMYLSLEMDRYMLKHFTEGLTDNTPAAEEASNRMLLVPVGNPINLNSEEGIRYVENLLKNYAPDVLFIDALGSLTFSDLSEVEGKAIMTSLKRLIKEYGTTFFLIHHNRKGDKQAAKTPPTLSDVYGNQYLVTDAALVLTLWAPDNAGHTELITLKSRARMADKPIVLDGTQGFSFVFREVKMEEEVVGDTEPSLFNRR